MGFWDDFVENISNNLEEQNERRIEAHKNIKAFGDALPRDVKLNIDKEYYSNN